MRHRHWRKNNTTARKSVGASLKKKSVVRSVSRVQRMRERVKVFTLLQPPPTAWVCVLDRGGQEWGEVATIDQFSVRVNASSLSQTHRISLSLVKTTPLRTHLY